MLNAHRILVVPSEFVEPFGVVALEGIACGCFVIGSEGGGLKDAIGPFGVTFPNGDHDALARQLGECLSNPASMSIAETVLRDNLDRHLPERIAGQYVELFEGLLEQGSSARR